LWQYLCISIVILTFSSSLQASQEKKVDLIVFSFDRPLQLHALLCSINTYVTQFENICVLFRTSTSAYEQAYNEVRSLFPDVIFVQQGTEPKKDFKPLLLHCFYGSPSAYIAFSTDDLLIKDSIDTAQCIDALEQTAAYGFYLRLGDHITYSYNRDIPLVVPPLAHVMHDVYAFKFKDGQSYWAYPNTVDIAIYKKSTIEAAFTTLEYTSPNILESRWARQADLSGIGLCFRTSKGFNIPLNLVQDDWYNKNTAQFTAQELLDFWNQGKQMDIVPFHGVMNSSATMPYVPTFIARNRFHKEGVCSIK
jgi:hypothetical protein